MHRTFAAIAVLAALLPSSTRADDRAPPLCTDERTLEAIKYNYHRNSGDVRRLREIKEVIEISYGPSPFHQKQLINSRFCRAIGLLDNGETDTLFWRLDWVDEGSAHSIQRLNCSFRHDVFNDKCRLWRPKEFPPQ
jgi:hypothetical protein